MVLDAFKVKPFHLQPVLDNWKDGPRFRGNAKKDPRVEEWLDQIKAGCIQRHIPEEYWYKAAQHFMGSKARARFDNVNAVVNQVNGGKYRWTWKKFKVAMINMGWGVDASATETVKVQGKSFLWFSRKREDRSSEPPSPKRSPTRASSLFSLQKHSDTKSSSESTPRRPHRSNSDTFWPLWKKEEVAEPKPTPHRSKSETSVAKAPSENGSEVSMVTNAPVWLLNACTALDYLTSEHPKAMSILSAVLITAGSLPALPAITAGAGGAVLASSAAQAVGAIAVGIGQALGASVVKNNNQESQASSTVR
ncbi:hypothetical protein AMATHDRAFT_6746 [Amanita thiersii Skay4041]|uniref:Uncharacterized protein n=1 Tax=Amanita thiersii Skay4041 TaxID=703135 RepID=A0A2A9NDR3_9AGAR|nr:hypothetical protein AMATHDRAFT_6746 [Amanita thiersii Skay4041]